MKKMPDRDQIAMFLSNWSQTGLFFRKDVDLVEAALKKFGNFEPDEWAPEDGGLPSAEEVLRVEGIHLISYLEPGPSFIGNGMIAHGPVYSVDDPDSSSTSDIFMKSGTVHRVVGNHVEVRNAIFHASPVDEDAEEVLANCLDVLAAWRDDAFSSPMGVYAHMLSSRYTWLGRL